MLPSDVARGRQFGRDQAKRLGRRKRRRRTADTYFEIALRGLAVGITR